MIGYDWIVLSHLNAIVQLQASVQSFILLRFVHIVIRSLYSRHHG